DHRRVVGDIERHAFGLARDPRIARRAPELCRQRRRCDLPRQRMFAAAGTEQENVHEMSDARIPGSPQALDALSTHPHFSPSDAAMISCRVATWRAKAARPVEVAVTVVCGFLPTKALSTVT